MHPLLLVLAVVIASYAAYGWRARLKTPRFRRIIAGIAVCGCLSAGWGAYLRYDEWNTGRQVIDAVVAAMKTERGRAVMTDALRQVIPDAAVAAAYRDIVDNRTGIEIIVPGTPCCPARGRFITCDVGRYVVRYGGKWVIDDNFPCPGKPYSLPARGG